MYTSRVDISPNSGLLRVTIHPSRHPWLSIPLQTHGSPCVHVFMLVFANCGTPLAVAEPTWRRSTNPLIPRQLMRFALVFGRRFGMQTMRPAR